METDVTIINNNIGRYILDMFQDYQVIDKKINFKDILKYEKVIFYKILDYEKEDKLQELVKRLKKNKIKFIVITNNIELTLLCQNIIVMDNKEIILEGETTKILKDNVKVIKKIGLDVPFMLRLSIYLQDYDLLDSPYFYKESLKSKLWN